MSLNTEMTSAFARVVDDDGMCVMYPGHTHRRGPNRSFTVSAFMTRDLSDHELCQFNTANSGNVLSWNLCETNRQTKSGYNNPFRRIETKVQGTKRQADCVRRVCTLVEKFGDISAIAFQEVDLIDIRVDQTKMKTFRRGPVMLVVSDPDSYELYLNVDKESMPLFVDSDGMTRFVAAYSPKYRVVYMSVHFKWMALGSVHEKKFDSDLSLLILSMQEKAPNATHVCIVGDFNMEDETLPDLKLTRSFQQFARAFSQDGEALTTGRYTNSRIDADLGVAVSTASDYVYEIPLKIVDVNCF